MEDFDCRRYATSPTGAWHDADMAELSPRELITAAAAALKPIEFAEHRIVGDVAAALQTIDGELFTGVCIDTPSWGLCAERSAAAAMLTAGHHQVSRLVAVWQEHRPGRGDDLFVLPPCGYCRQFLLDIHPNNANTIVVLSAGRSARLEELLPLNKWPDGPID